jgi:bis(5'-nucleosyl)-tetraphosphatase (symmetrical)
MAIYAIGDIQGCFDELLLLLDKISFNEQSDQLWFVGDLVNRGAKSLETLRFVKNLGAAAITVLGNHDIHLLVTATFPERAKKKDTLNAIFTAPDKDELLDWLRHRPLFHYENGFGLLHAGLPPQWDVAQTQAMATLAEAALRGADYQTFLAQLYGNQSDVWTDDLAGIDQLRFIINCFTRMRFCDKKGRLDFENSGEIGSQPAHLFPWFTLPERKSADTQLIFGHWSALGYHTQQNCFAIDTGCIWGRELTAIRLDSDSVQRFSVASSLPPKRY